METTIVQPGTTPSIYSTGDHGRHHHDEGRRFDAVEARADYRSLTAEVERFGTQNLASAARTNEIVQAGSCRTDSLVQAGFGDTSDRICASTKDVTTALGTGFTAAALAACKTSDEVAAVYAGLQKQISDAATATVVGFKEAQGLAFQNLGLVQLEAAKNAAAIGVQATANFNALTVQATQNTYQLSLEAVKNAAAAALTAATDRAAVLAAIEKCCCEASKERAAFAASLTATVTAGNVAIIGKLDQGTIDGLRAQLVATQRLIPVTIPVGAG